MSTTTMHFGPEWMRAKQQPQARSQAPPSPPPASNLQSATSTYSAVSAIPTGQNDKQDEVHPFRYSKDELLKIYKESPKGSLGLEVERWEGVVREIGSDPVGLREMGEGEKKLFAGPLNSDLRRRQSTDYLSPLNLSSLGTERTRLSHNSPSGAGSPLRERYGGLKRRDSNADSPTPTLARKTSLSALQSPSIGSRNSAGLASPRIRQGFNGGAFDGVLGETWTPRRRISEASKPGAISTDSSGGLSVDSGDKATGLQGEGREVGDPGANQGRGTPSHIETPSTPDSSGRRQASGVSTPNGSGTSNAPGVAPGQPAEPKDLAAVEWSYKDPSGNIQGPFRADIMQKWYDDGYFAAELPMKRVQYDADWITVGELMKRASGDKIFLSPLRHAGPPGLTKRESPPLQSIAQQPGENVFTNPYQPAPIRSLRSSTLDSFNGSNPSDSPSSSLGHFGNNSPDPLAFGGLAGTQHGYMGGDGNGMYGLGALDINGLRRTHLQDYHEPNRLHSPSYGNIMNSQGFNNGHLYSAQYNTVQASPWGTPSHDAYGAYNNGNYNAAGAFGGHSPFNPQLPNQVIGGQVNPLLYGGSDLNPLNAVKQFNQHLGGVNNIPNEQQFSNAAQDYGVQQYQQATPAIETKTENAEFAHQQESQVPQGGAPAAWDTTPSAHPTALNTAVPTAPSQSSPWGQLQEPAQSAQPAATPSKDASPWVLASQGVLETPWTAPQESEAPAKLEKLEEEPAELKEEPVAVPSLPTPAASPPVEASQAPAPKGKKGKATAAAAAAAAAAPAPTPAPTDSPSPSPATPGTPSQKAPWAKDDKKKAKSPSTAISLREIQDAESKAAEARKTKQEKERASRLAASASLDSKEDVQPFTASWGLPTSQAGGRAAAKDAPAADVTSGSPVPPVWTNAPKAPAMKKTMKEIQEEEERRKKAAAKETVAAAAAKRAYAESTARTAPAPAPATNSAWVTVGASGKTGAAAAAPARPTLASVASSSSTTVRPTAAAAVRTTVQTSASRPAASSGGRVEDFPVSPSHEFLKWLTESLKGLNSSVNVEEIISMLLSFSLDPDPITIEIIQETVYANSTTLDGRRFAAEFVAKRKADAANRKGQAGGKASAKPVSIAEVVKATPKASQPEWGGFKVVNKKKKGGRA